MVWPHRIPHRTTYHKTKQSTNIKLCVLIFSLVFKKIYDTFLAAVRLQKERKILAPLLSLVDGATAEFLSALAALVECSRGQRRRSLPRLVRWHSRTEARP